MSRIKTMFNDMNAKSPKLFEKDVLHVLNGQVMYDEIYGEEFKGNALYAPFNEAMCINEMQYPILDESFIELRAQGHGVTTDIYKEKMDQFLSFTVNEEVNTIVLWFGNDMFCIMNALTALAYLEQQGFKGTVYLHHFDEKDYIVKEERLTLGNYTEVYKDVFLHNQNSNVPLLPVFSSAIELYLTLQQEDHEVIEFIKEHPERSENELVQKLFHRFPEIGYGDRQYIELIRKVRG